MSSFAQYGILPTCPFNELLVARGQTLNAAGPEIRPAPTQKPVGILYLSKKCIVSEYRYRLNNILSVVN